MLLFLEEYHLFSVHWFTSLLHRYFFCSNGLYLLRASWHLAIAKILEKPKDAPSAASEEAATILPDEQLSAAEMRLRIKLLQEDR